MENGMVDLKLKEYATPRQLEIIEAIERTGSQRGAAKELGLARGTIFNLMKAVTKRAAKAGYSPDHDMTRTVPDGFLVKGVSTMYDKEGNIAAQWVKSSIDRERQTQILTEAIGAMADALPKVAPRPEPTGEFDTKLMACYPIGDAHIGMLSWPEETGEDWNLDLAERMHCTAMAHLVESAPASEEATIINLGDWFHADNLEGVTSRSGHNLDMDSRYAKMARVGVKIMRQCIESALSKHKRVRVINAVGNHDDTGSLMLSICLANVYENEPRVTIETSPSAFHYFRHGKCLVGIHHGHSTKAERLPGVMAADRAKDWGESEFRYWWCGHVHHQSMKDYAGVSVESFRVLAAKDAYAHWGGYRAPRDMKCIVLHSEYGEVARNTVNPAMVAHLM
jgi:UDP-2,3-diacylglucosamine pyrophosphatase LpxH